MLNSVCLIQCKSIIWIELIFRMNAANNNNNKNEQMIVCAAAVRILNIIARTGQLATVNSAVILAWTNGAAYQLKVVIACEHSIFIHINRIIICENDPE